MVKWAMRLDFAFIFIELQASTMDTEFARAKMIEQQVRAWDVLDKIVLDTLAATPREAFVPPAYRALAFADAEVPIGHGERMMSPTVEGRVLQALELTSSDRILEIGTGSGYLTACLAKLGSSVVSVELHSDLLAAAKDRLDEAGIGNVELLEMDAMRELPDGRFDAIAVTGSIQRFDPRFVESLRPGGRLFVVVGDPPVMDARSVRVESDNEWSSESLFETVLRPLVHGAEPPQFAF